jgi:tetratricopeptide (TPR) repeat protein
LHVLAAGFFAASPVVYGQKKSAEEAPPVKPASGEKPETAKAGAPLPEIALKRLQALRDETATFEQLFSPENSEVLRTLKPLVHGLADAADASPPADAARYLAEAEAVVRRAYTIREKKLGPAHADTLEAGRMLAWTLNVGRKFDEGEAMLRRILAVRKDAPANDPDVLNDSAALAACLSAAGKNAEAEPLYRSTYAAFEALYGKNHNLTLYARDGLSQMLEKVGKFAEEEKLLLESLKLTTDEGGEKDPKAVVALLKYAMYLNNRGRKAEALPMAEKVYELANANPIPNGKLQKAAADLREKARKP